MQVGKSEVPNFLKSSSATSLRRMMLKECSRFGGSVSFFDIQFAQGFWFAWYYVSYSEAMNNEKMEIAKNEIESNR